MSATEHHSHVRSTNLDSAPYEYSAIPNHVIFIFVLIFLKLLQLIYFEDEAFPRIRLKIRTYRPKIPQNQLLIEFFEF